MALPFIPAESEETASQRIVMVGIIAATFGLLFMNVCGAIAGTEGASAFEIVIRIAFAIVVSGCEIIAAVALLRIMLAPTMLRMAVGTAIFFGLAWVCIQNGKKAAAIVFPELKESAALLDAKSQIAADQASLQKGQRDAAAAAIPQQLEKVQTQIADLRAEQQLMASRSPEKIKEAQALLIAQGKYFGRVDGVRAELTEAAMRARGEEIANEMQRLKLREESLTGAGVATVAIDAALKDTNGEITDPAVLKAVLDEKSRKAKATALRIEIMLWVVEGARSLGLWALVSEGTRKGHRNNNSTATARNVGKEEDELDAEGLRIREEAQEDGDGEELLEEQEDEEDPEVEDAQEVNGFDADQEIEEDLDGRDGFTEAQMRASHAGQAGAHYREADQAIYGNKIPVPGSLTHPEFFEEQG